MLHLSNLLKITKLSICSLPLLLNAGSILAFDLNTSPLGSLNGLELSDVEDIEFINGDIKKPGLEIKNIEIPENIASFWEQVNLNISRQIIYNPINQSYALNKILDHSSELSTPNISRESFYAKYVLDWLVPQLNSGIIPHFFADAVVIDYDYNFNSQKP